MQLCSLRQGTVSQWSTVPRRPRVLQVLLTMYDSSLVSQHSQSQLSDIVGSTCNTLGQRGTMLHEDTVPKAKLHRLDRLLHCWVFFQTTVILSGQRLKAYHTGRLATVLLANRPRTSTQWHTHGHQSLLSCRTGGAERAMEESDEANIEIEKIFNRKNRLISSSIFSYFHKHGEFLNN